MTDPLATDLRELLARHAAGVTADADADERVIGDRLTAGDAGLAGDVAIGSLRRRPLLVAAATILVVAVGAALLLAGDDDHRVDTGPAATTPAVPASVLEFRPVLTQFPCAGMSVDGVLTGPDGAVCYQVGDPLPGNPLIESTRAFEQAASCGELVCVDDGRDVTG